MKGVIDRLTTDLILRQKRCIFRFRANLIVEGGEAFGEETWSGFQIGGAAFKVGGPCRRWSSSEILILSAFRSFIVSIFKHNNLQVPNDNSGARDRRGEIYKFRTNFFLKLSV